VESPTGSPRLVRARQIVNSRRKQAITAGLVPVPYVDVLIAGGIQLAMLRSLAELYEVPFHKTRARALCGALVGSLTPHMAAWGTVGALKLAPGVGLIVGSASMAVASGVFTSALGQLFIVHFEAGGTLLTFDPSKMRDHFERELQAAQQSE
jgi:uncharacterized protein (DUF697 family)